MSRPVYLAIAVALMLASPAGFAQNQETTRIVPQPRAAPQSRFTPARCEQMARELAWMRGALGSFPAPQRANIERQLLADERTYKQECLPK
jgi:hypothetical protein